MATQYIYFLKENYKCVMRIQIMAVKYLVFKCAYIIFFPL